MLNTARLRSIYSKLQTQLFYMIPEKWDKIYLYASIIEKASRLQTGEMFFYYYPKGILKKNAINVYEIPVKFNIDETEYMKLVNQLYETIKLLRKEFEDAKERLWTNLTISIENLKFHVEYNYEDLLSSPYSNYDRHIIWQYKYLGYPIERLSKRDRQMVKQYLLEEKFENRETKKYTEGMYKNNVHNIVEYDKVENNVEQIEEIDRIYTQIRDKESREDKYLDKYELYKRRKEEEKQNQVEISTIIEEQKEKKKNQILNF